MLTLYGVAVTAENARHIVASLFADGSPAAMSAAAMIHKGVDRDLYAVALEPEERDAILAVLEDPPAGLEDLRGRLARDHRHRHPCQHNVNRRLKQGASWTPRSRPKRLVSGPMQPPETPCACPPY